MLEPLYNDAAGLKACNFVKNRLQHRCFSVNIVKSLRTTILKNSCERLLLQNDIPDVCWKNFLNGSGELESNFDSWDIHGTGLNNSNKVFNVGNAFAVIDVNCGDWI